jgi:hypothetical protein
MSSNEELYEYYGWKAAERGLFKEWQAKTSSILESNPEMNRWDAGQKAYGQLIGSV